MDNAFIVVDQLAGYLLVAPQAPVGPDFSKPAAIPSP